MKSHQPTTLLHLSGGQDSTFVLFDWLRKNPHETILVHHVNLFHKAENRLNPEKKAVRNILEWLRKNKLDNFIYEESEFSYGSLDRITVKDIQIISVFTSIILKTPRFESIRTLLLSWHEGEVFSEEINRGFRVKKMMEALEVPEGKVTLEFPIMNMTREDMLHQMPLSLFKLIHSCRKPINFSPCGKCKTCLEFGDLLHYLER
jgi:7-cyano-7-deazaguanine synthase in queuosine biosynthesis